MTNIGFKDYFSSHAKIYAQHRPPYPPELFAYLSSLVEQHEAAWDCATGNGQVAIGLTPYFQHIFATDASHQQLAHAIAHPQITYTVATAEHSTLPDRSVDLVTVGLALHWFNIELFYQEVRRVLRPTGAIAVWGYSDVELPTAPPFLQDKLTEFRQRVYPFFAPEIKYVFTRYQTISFPFIEVQTPEFVITARWTLDALIGYLQSLSGTQRFREKHGATALNTIAQSIITAWQNPETPLQAEWKIFMKIGKLE